MFARCWRSRSSIWVDVVASPYNNFLVFIVTPPIGNQSGGYYLFACAATNHQRHGVPVTLFEEFKGANSPRLWCGGQCQGHTHGLHTGWARIITLQTRTRLIIGAYRAGLIRSLVTRRPRGTSQQLGELLRHLGQGISAKRRHYCRSTPVAKPNKESGLL